MIELLRILGVALILLGLFFMIASSLGLIRLPDIYTRAHASGKCDALGQALMLFGFVLYTDFGPQTVKLVLIMVMLYILTPTATHAIVRAAYIHGKKPWKRGEERE